MNARSDARKGLGLQLLVGLTFFLKFGLSDQFSLGTYSRSYTSSTAFINKGNSPRMRRSIRTQHSQRNDRPSLSFSCLSTAANDNDSGPSKEEFWAQQLQLAEEMSNAADVSLNEEQRKKFATRRLALVGDTAFIGFFIACILWTIFDNPFVTLSYALGTLSGTAYAFGLGKYVENLGRESESRSSGVNVGDARFAFLFLLFVIVNRFKDSGILVIPTVLGFFTYQIASLTQGLRENID